MLQNIGQSVVLVQFGHLWNLVEVGFESLAQTHFEFRCQVEIEQYVVEVHDWFGLEFLFHVKVGFVVLV